MKRITLLMSSLLTAFTMASFAATSFIMMFLLIQQAAVSLVLFCPRDIDLFELFPVSVHQEPGI